MTSPEMQPRGDCDVVVAGAGVAGLAAGVLLARMGLRTVLIDPKPFPRSYVGESLDWSAPPLLRRLGLPCDGLVATATGTYKREIRAATRDRGWSERPPGWLGRPPLRFGLTTVHLDRERFDERLYAVARAAGVGFVWEPVTGVDLADDRVTAFRTRSGRPFRGAWFIDASGRSRVVARSAGIGERRFGIPKVALWAQVDLPMRFEGTALYADDRPEYLDWAWEIPIGTSRQSVGAVMPASRFRALRAAGGSLEELLAERLRRFSRFEDLSADRLRHVQTRGYRCYVSERVSGRNWMMIGEAAAFADPLTSFGVTAALRHASEAAWLIDEDRRSPVRTAARLGDFDRRVRGMSRLYNDGIEGLVYRAPPRRAFGIRRAARAYVFLGYLMNALYTRLRPLSRRRTIAVGALLAAFRLWATSWIRAGRWVATWRSSLGRGAGLTPDDGPRAFGS